MNLNNISDKLHHLSFFAEKWGISDDSEREIQVENTDSQELKELVLLLTDDEDILINEWLCGDESKSSYQSNEYIQYSCLIMSIIYARYVLSDRNVAI